MFRKRVLFGALLLALLIAAVTVAGIQLAGGETERLTNGDFESGFYAIAVGHVANGWQWFQNGGEAQYGFYDETWAPVVYEGEHSTMIEINTWGLGGSDPDRYAGIYQTVRVVSGETYNLTLSGQIRSGEGDIQASQYGYRMQLGIDDGGGQDWTAVEDWVELPWDEQRFDSDSLFFYDYSLLFFLFLGCRRTGSEHQ